MPKRVKESLPAEENVEAGESVEEGMAIVPVTKAEQEPVSIPRAKGSGFGQWVGRFLLFLFRLLLVLALLAALAAGLYFGLPLVYQRYILPVQENTSQLQELRAQQEGSEQIIADLQARLEVIESGQAEHSDSLTDLDGRLSEIETGIATHTQELESLEKIQATLQSQNDAISAELEEQVKLLKAMELLSRARLFMYQSNFGLARQDVQIARDLLGSLQLPATDPRAEDVDAVILRLDLTLSNLPDFPVIASDDLDIAWQILLGGAPVVEVTSTPPPAPEATFTPTPFSTEEPTATP